MDGVVVNYPWAGWRRHYKEFAALAEMLSKSEEPTVSAEAIQLILQAYAQACRVGTMARPRVAIEPGMGAITP